MFSPGLNYTVWLSLDGSFIMPVALKASSFSGSRLQLFDGLREAKKPKWRKIQISADRRFSHPENTTKPHVHVDFFHPMLVYGVTAKASLILKDYTTQSQNGVGGKGP